MKIEVYTDGSATTNKPGGWAYVLVVDGQKRAECCGHMENATNNDAEMQAAIEGLKNALKFIVDELPDYRLRTEPLGTLEVYLVSDSQLILGWADGSYRFKQVDKLEKYHTLQELVRRMRVKTRWVRGHNGDEFNERCDELANEARLSVINKKVREEQKERGETLIGTKKSGVVCVWYKNTLKIVDLETNVVENYSRDVHGPRGSMLEIREEKSR